MKKKCKKCKNELRAFHIKLGEFTEYVCDNCLTVYIQHHNSCSFSDMPLILQK